MEYAQILCLLNLKMRIKSGDALKTFQIQIAKKHMKWGLK